MPKDIQERHQKSLSLKELRELIEFRFLVRMVEIQKVTEKKKKEEEDAASAGIEAKKETTSNIPTFRFCVGQKVKCNCGNTWLNGKIVAILYREPHWPQGKYVPYQVRLDSGRLIYAPMDDDRLIQSVGEVLKKPDVTMMKKKNISSGKKSDRDDGHHSDKKNDDHSHGHCGHSHSGHSHSHGGHHPSHHDDENETSSAETTARPGLSKRKNAKKMMESTPDDYDGFSL